MQDRNTTTTPPNYPHPPVQQLKLDPIFCHIVSIVHTPKGSEHKRIRAYKKKENCTVMKHGATLYTPIQALNISYVIC